MASIATHLGRTRGWLALLLIVPLVGGIVAAAIVARQPVDYTVTAVVQVQPPSGTPQSVAVATYVDAVTSVPVATEAAGSAGVPANEVIDSLTSVGSLVNGKVSGLVSVTYRGADEAKAGAITTAAAIAAQEVLYQRPVATAEAAVAAAAQANAAAEAAAQAPGDQQVLQTTAELRRAERVLADIKAQLASATSVDAVTLASVEPVDPTTEIMRAGVTGALIGFVLAGVCVAVVAIVRAGRSQTRSVKSDATSPTADSGSDAGVPDSQPAPVS